MAFPEEDLTRNRTEIFNNRLASFKRYIFKVKYF